MSFIGDRIVVALNAAFDMGILKAMLNCYRMESRRSRTCAR